MHPGAAAAVASAVQTVSRENARSRSTQTISTGHFSIWRQGTHLLLSMKTNEIKNQERD